MITLEREKLLSELEQKIGYSFRSRALLDRALTHRSFANERAEEKCQHNEALEFLGDSVLGLVVSSWLLERFPDLSEGKLSKMKAFLVSEASLVELAEGIDLGRYILLNRGEEKTGGRRKRALLADAYEALIGVIYIDGGIASVERFLRRELRDRVMAIDPSAMIGADYKSALQEQLQAVGAPCPEYVVVEALGPDHRRIFRVALRVGGRCLATGEGRTIKLAQQEAAQAAMTSPDFIANIAALQSVVHFDEEQSDEAEAKAVSVGSSESADQEWTHPASGRIAEESETFTGREPIAASGQETYDGTDLIPEPSETRDA
ncbi:MAG TPA: ribonuclease III [Blastocatellia bacterium]|nr:ribonuclease III [Blastocatellia bacterium]